MVIENLIETDVLVIGGGLAGIFAAIKAQEEGVSVTLVEKAYVGRAGASLFAQCFSVFNPAWGHDLNQWMNRVALLGDYINNPEWTKITLKESLDRYNDLVSWGVEFTKGPDGEPFRISEGVLENLVHGGGWRLLPLLRKQAVKRGIKIFDRLMVTDLLKQDGKIAGAAGFQTRNGDYYVFQAKATVMCTGFGNIGISDNVEKPFSFDGEAMAYRAGATMSGKEFSNGGGFLTPLTESIGLYADTGRKSGKVNLKGREIKPSPLGWHAPIMGLGRLVDSEGNIVSSTTMIPSIARGRGPILYDLDAGNPEDIKAMSERIKHQDIDLLGESIVNPAEGGLYSGITRYEGIIGSSVYGGGSGIRSTDTKGSTSIEGLFAAGDCYNSGAVGSVYPCHGFGTRNAAVTGAIAGTSAARFARQAVKTELNPEETTMIRKSLYAPLERAGGFDAEWVSVQIKNIMTPYYVWLVRQGDRLKAALTNIEFLNNNTAPMMYCRDTHGLKLVHEAKGRLLITEMMLRSALFRTESRGSHYREDYPRRDDINWLADVNIRVKNGKMDLKKQSRPQNWGPDPSKPYNEKYPRRFMDEQP
jgi:succinate dehydrogenase/fumarate reductase flavoprotein subunit